MKNEARFTTTIVLIATLVLVVGCSNPTGSSNDTSNGGGSTGGGNLPPYPVTGPTQTPEFDAYTNLDQEYQLEIERVDGLCDPDGDQVFFRSNALPPFMELNEVTGLVTIFGDSNAAGPLPEEIEVEFWSEDEHGADTSAQPYSVTFRIVGT